MKSKRIKKFAFILAAFFGVIVLSGCTANFCADIDRANILVPFDKSYVEYTSEATDEKSVQVFADNTNIFMDYDISNSEIMKRTIETAESSKITIPTNQYFIEMEKILLLGNEDVEFEGAFSMYVDKVLEDESRTITTANATVEDVNNAYKYFAYTRYYKEGDALFDPFLDWTNYLRSDAQLGLEQCPNSDFLAIYINNANTQVSTITSCIATTPGEYGSYGPDNESVNITEKDWGYAWSKGFLEGLIIYPIAIMIDTFAIAFGLGGWGQVFAIALVTLIVKGIVFAITFKGTMGQQKMTMLQPEISKLQAKYPNSNTNQAQKQRLAQEQQALYKKHKINIFAPFITLILQFPVFICVWGAMQGAAVLSTDSVLGLQLDTSIWDTVSNFASWPNFDGWWTAAVLFILLTAAQIISMKLPQIIQKRREKQMPKLTKNPAAQSTQKQMKIIMYVMMAVIIFMGATLPAGMAVYWFMSALFSIGQTFVTQAILSRQINKKNRGRK